MDAVCFPEKSVHNYKNERRHIHADEREAQRGSDCSVLLFACGRGFRDAILSEQTKEWFCTAARSAAEVACLVWLFVSLFLCLPLSVQPVSHFGQQQAGQLMQVASKMYKRFQVFMAVAIGL